MQVASMPGLLAKATRRCCSRAVRSYRRSTGPGSTRAWATSAGEATRSAHACWNSASMGHLRGAGAGGADFVRQVMHTAQLSRDALQTQGLEVGLVELEDDGAQAGEAAGELPRGLP